MRHLFVIAALLSVAFAANAAEQLPNQAVLQKSSPQHGPGKTLSGAEMASLYLQSPTLVSNAETKNGIDAVSDEKRYASTNLVQRDRLSEQNMPRANMAPPPKPEPPANPLLLMPLLQQLHPGR